MQEISPSSAIPVTKRRALSLIIVLHYDVLGMEPFLTSFCGITKVLIHAPGSNMVENQNGRLQ